MMALRIANTAALARVRDRVRPLDHDDERLMPGAVVVIHRGPDIVATLACADDIIAWSAYRICAGIRFRRETIAETMLGQSEVDALIAA
jgi:hypothetical protein